MMSVVANEVLDELLAFRQERDWEKFHTPKDLSIALSVEASELLECFLWVKDADLDEVIVRERDAIDEEIADVAILLSYLCHDLKIDLDKIVRAKIGKNREKYPKHLAYGIATKYDKLK